MYGSARRRHTRLIPTTLDTMGPHGKRHGMTSDPVAESEPLDARRRRIAAIYDELAGVAIGVERFVPAHRQRRMSPPRIRSTRSWVAVAVVVVAATSACTPDDQATVATDASPPIIDPTTMSPGESPSVDTAGSSAQPSGVSLSDIDGIKWYVTTVDGLPLDADLHAWFRVSTNLGQRAGLDLEGDANVRIDGFDGCNQYVSWGSFDGHRITVLSGESTVVGCAPPQVSFPSGADLILDDGSLIAIGPPELVAVSEAVQTATD